MNMSSTLPRVHAAVRWLKSDDEATKQKGAFVLRELAANVANKEKICLSGGLELLLDTLEGGWGQSTLVVSTEVVALLVTENDDARTIFRELQGVQTIINLLQSRVGPMVFHRALLVLRILTDKEIDRYMIWKAGGMTILLDLLRSINGVDTELIEFAAAALGNMAAGSHEIKDALRDAGAMGPLIKLLQGPHSAAAELAAVALRNMSLGHTVNKELLQSLDGLEPLLGLLSLGQERLEYPLHCTAFFADDTGTSRSGRNDCEGMCNFNPTTGQLNIALHDDNGVARCFVPGKHNLREKNLLVFSLLRRLTITEPENQTLEISFTSRNSDGARCLTSRRSSQRQKARHLQTVLISPCSASELKASLMRMLTKLHLQSEFNILPSQTCSDGSNSGGSSKYGKSVSTMSSPDCSSPHSLKIIDRRLRHARSQPSLTGSCR